MIINNLVVFLNVLFDLLLPSDHPPYAELKQRNGNKTNFSSHENGPFL
jgi:hypothetical protein